MLKHGFTANGTTIPEYKIWTTMKQRCENPKDKKFPRYGGRGISVCERWQSVENFISDMGPRPAGYSIERKNNDGNYEPTNCIWASRKTQQRNRGVNKRVEYRGREMTLFDAVRLSNTIVPYSTIYFRLIQGWDLLRALSEPIKKVGRPRLEHPKRERVGV